MKKDAGGGGGGLVTTEPDKATHLSPFLLFFPPPLALDLLAHEAHSVTLFPKNMNARPNSSTLPAAGQGGWRRGHGDKAW